MKIIVDTLGCDDPDKIVLGAVNATRTHPDINIVLSGYEDKINNILNAVDYDKSRISILPCSEEITNEDVPTVAIKTKSESSLVKSFDMLRRDNEVVGLISAGSTGAILTGTFLKVGRIRGVSRPAMAPLLPTKIPDKRVLIIDCGANVDCKPINLCHFALMGSIYMKEVFGIKEPKVGLLSNGTEDKKGTDLVREANHMIRQLPINFVGNIEARETLSGEIDVVVTDGYSGNVLLKSIEGSVKFAMSVLKNEIKHSFWAKLGVLFMGKAFKGMKNKLNYHNYGGSPFIGAKKIVIKSHGSSDEAAIEVCINQVINMANNNLCQHIEDEISKIEFFGENNGAE